MIGGRATEWHWLWNAYVVGGCLCGVAAAVLLRDRFPGNVPLAIAALACMAVWAIALIRPVLRTESFDWRCVVFVAVTVALFFLALLAAPTAVAAIPAIYPLIFAPLPLPLALVVTTTVNVTPLIIALSVHGLRWPNLPMAVALTLIGLV